MSDTESARSGQPVDYRNATAEQARDAVAQIRLYGEIRTPHTVSDEPADAEITDYRTASDAEFHAELTRLGVKRNRWS